VIETNYITFYKYNIAQDRGPLVEKYVCVTY
jgi:hypothetical protein